MSDRHWYFLFREGYGSHLLSILPLGYLSLFFFRYPDINPLSMMCWNTFSHLVSGLFVHRILNLNVIKCIKIFYFTDKVLLNMSLPTLLECLSWFSRSTVEPQILFFQSTPLFRHSKITFKGIFNFCIIAHLLLDFILGILYFFIITAYVTYIFYLNLHNPMS